MRILYLCADPGVPVLGRKGASVHVRALVTALRGAGHDVALAAASLVRSPWEQPVELDVPIVHIPPSEGTKRVMDALKDAHRRLGVETTVPGEVRRVLHDDEVAATLLRRLEREPPDLVYERASLHALAGMRVARALDVPRIVEVNAPLVLEQEQYRGEGLRSLAAAAERETLTQADAVVVVSESLRDYAVAHGAAPERVHVIPNAVDPSLFAPSANGKDGREPVLGFVGGLRPWHGVEALPELVARLAPQHPRLRLVIAGDGPLRAQLQRSVATAGVHDRVVFTRSLPHEDLPDVIRRFDVALAPYDAPAHDFYFSPLKLFEYMACGVPVVAARVGQVEEVVRDGETGLLYPPGELDALAEACDRLLRDEDLRRRLGSAAASEVRERYTWQLNAERVTRIGHELLRARRQL